jgi:hypothetical protein
MPGVIENGDLSQKLTPGQNLPEKFIISQGMLIFHSNCDPGQNLLWKISTSPPNYWLEDKVSLEGMTNGFFLWH